MVFQSNIRLEERAANILKSTSLIAISCLLLSHAELSASDIYALPEGKGDLSGSSWENALGVNGNMQSAWDKLTPGDTLYFGSGEYKSSTVKITEGGSAGTPKAIVGKDTGAGLPVLTGNWKRSSPSKGSLFIQLEEGASNISVSHLNFKNVKAVVYGRGENSNLDFSNIHGESQRYGFYLLGGKRETNRSTNIKISDCTFHGFTKSAVRLQDGTSNVVVENVTADAGGKEFATEKFHMAFNIQGDHKAKKAGRVPMHDHNISFINCEARNCYNERGDKYWNADGFVAERGVHNIKYINCRAFDCTDGGWDFKAHDVELVNCIALRNKRNFRIWAQADMKNCVAAYAVYPGGSGGPTGLFLTKDAQVTATNCTFVNNPGSQISIEDPNGARLVLKDCVIGSTLDPSKDLIRKGDNATVEKIDCLLFQTSGAAPKFVDLNPDWQGTGNSFNNDSGKGYRSDS